MPTFARSRWSCATVSFAIVVRPDVAIAAVDPSGFGIPVEFFLFPATLLGVALFHHHTLGAALIGLASITFYKLLVTGFKTGQRLAGPVAHLEQERVILANLLGFALLSNHFEKSHMPEASPRFLPDDWKEASQCPDRQIVPASAEACEFNRQPRT